MFFFFFKQRTAYEIYQCDWSSDVCSSDLILEPVQEVAPTPPVEPVVPPPLDAVATARYEQLLDRKSVV